VQVGWIFSLQSLRLQMAGWIGQNAPVDRKMTADWISRLMTTLITSIALSPAISMMMPSLGKVKRMKPS